MSLYNDASLVMIPSAYKDGKLYSIKPTDGSGDFTFSRGSNLAATRVDENGLIEKGRENLLLQSNQFDTTWGVGTGTINGGQTDKDGGSSAWSFTSVSAGNGLAQTISVSGVKTFSAYIKKNATYGVRIYMFGTTNVSPYFNLNTGSVVSLSNAVDATIEEYNTDWWRISVTTPDTATNSVYFYVTNNSATQVAGTITIQDAQLEQGLVATDYIETTTTTAQAGILEDMPRLDYSGGASCPSLLLEPQRTNLFVQSEYFGAWGLSNAILTANDVESPEGVINGYKLNEDTANSTHRITQTSFVTTGQVYTQSVFAKGDGSGRYLRMFRGSGTYNFAVFNLTSGEIVSQGGSNLISTNIEAYSNGWYKCSITFTAQFSNIASYIGLQNGSFDSYAGDGTSGIYIYGAMLESGSYPTSYIPCYGAATTRSEDSCTKTGISSLIGQEQGTLFVEATNFFLSGNRTIALLYTSGSAFYQVYINASNQVRVDVNGTFLFLGGSIAANTNYKIAFAYKSAEYALYINGTQIATSTNTTIPSSLTNYYLGNSLGGEQSGEFAQTALFKTRLTNGELAALTTI